MGKFVKRNRQETP